MNRKNKLFGDILNCISKIENRIENNFDFEKYAQNEIIQESVERNLITIGEAVNNLLKLDAEIKISNARKIVNARNKLTHGYDDIEITQVWSIVVKHLPILKSEVENLIQN